MALGNVHVGSSTTSTYKIGNGGTTTSIRGAIQTGGTTPGNITDSRLSGAGVTAGNFGLVAAGGSTGAYSVTFTPGTTAGALTNQRVYITNNFDNVRAQALAITGTAWDYASATITPGSSPSSLINLGIIHTGDSFAPQTLTVRNASGAYRENLNASFSGTSGGATTNGASMTRLAPGATNTTMAVGLSAPVSAGTVTGNVTIGLTSDGSGNSGLGQTLLASQTVYLAGQVNNYANPILGFVSGNGTFSGSGRLYTLDFGTVRQGSGDLLATFAAWNDVLGPADLLDGKFTVSGSSPFGFRLTDFANLGAGEKSEDLYVSLSTLAIGDFSDSIIFSAVGHNESGYSQESGSITLSIKGEVAAATVPLPHTALLLGCGMAGLAALRRRSGR